MHASRHVESNFLNGIDVVDGVLALFFGSVLKNWTLMQTLFMNKKIDILRIKKARHYEQLNVGSLVYQKLKYTKGLCV